MICVWFGRLGEFLRFLLEICGSECEVDGKVVVLMISSGGDGQ